jgi:hypothetical protein
MSTAHPLQIRGLAGRVTIAQGTCCDLKIENNSGERWWLCRLPESDHRITIEQWDDNTNSWKTKETLADGGQR